MIDDVTSDGHRSRPRVGDDFERPASARVYDFILGGASHGAVDRDLGRRLMAAEPRVVEVARENRAFMRRAVDFLVDTGIDQFLDLGSGIPTMGSVGEVARRRRPGTRVVHVDVDPVAAAHAAHLLAEVEGVATARADLREPEAVLDLPQVRGLLDLSRPVGLLMVSVLQHIPDDDDPAGVIDRYLRRLAPGSALALSHLTDEDPRIHVDRIVSAAQVYAGGVGLHPRTKNQVATLLTGVDLVAPGLVWAAQWRPESTPHPALPACGHRAGVGFLPERSPA